MSRLMRDSERGSTLLRLAALGLLVVLGAAWLILPVLLELAYDGRAGAFLNNLLSGRGIHPLADYARSLERGLLMLTLVGLPTAALLAMLSSAPNRTRLARLVTGLGTVAPVLLAMVALGWLAWRIRGSLGLPHFGDADEKVIIAWVMAEGARLYGDVFSQHGPLNHLLAQLVYDLTGSKDIRPYRLAQWGLVVMSILLVAASPVLRSLRQRLLVAGLYAAAIALLYPWWKAQELLYSMDVGLAFAVALALLCLPVLTAVPVRSWSAAVGAAMLPAAAALGYPFAVSGGLVGLGTILVAVGYGTARDQLRDLWRPALTGMGTMVAGVLLWMLLAADVAGYLAYHVYLNQFIYSSFIGFAPTGALEQLARVGNPGFGWALMVVLILPYWVLRLRRSGRPAGGAGARNWVVILGLVLLVVGLLYLNPRNEENFKVAALQVPGSALLAIMLARWLAPIEPPGLRRSAIRLSATTALLLYLVALVSLTPFAGELSDDFIAKRQRTAAAEREAAAERIADIKASVPPDERIHVLVFLPRWYLMAERLPASGYLWYFPWQAIYDKRPVLGARIDLCQDLRRRPPKIVVFDDYAINGQHRLRDYAPCVYRFLRSEYRVLHAADPAAGFPLPALLVRRAPEPSGRVSATEP
jgi:hypothetical protein